MFRHDPFIDWLLDADPSIRWQVMRDLTDTPAETVATERSRVATEGWGPRLLDQQRPDGQWGDGVATPFWWSNMYTLVFLRDLGIDPTSARARTAIDLVRSNVTWGPSFGDSPFFEGEVEPCINGRVVALGAYFGERSDRLVDRLLGEQLIDGGWNCEAERGSVRSSFHTTICVLEGLLAFEQAFGATPAVTDARKRAHEYLLERRLLRRLSTGEIIDPAWTQFAFPPLWHYDLLRALDYLRAADVEPDARVEDAIAIVRERRQDDGRWLLDVRHRDTLHEELAGTVGAPNRWITLRALRVLDLVRRSDLKLRLQDEAKVRSGIAFVSLIGAFVIETTLDGVTGAEIESDRISGVPDDAAADAVVGVIDHGVAQFRGNNRAVLLGAKRAAGNLAADPDVQLLVRHVNDARFGRYAVEQPMLIDVPDQTEQRKDGKSTAQESDVHAGEKENLVLLQHPGATKCDGNIERRTIEIIDAVEAGPYFDERAAFAVHAIFHAEDRGEALQMIGHGRACLAELEAVVS